MKLACLNMFSYFARLITGGGANAIPSGDVQRGDVTRPLRFVFWGGVNTGISYLLFLFFLWALEIRLRLPAGYLLAHFASFSISVVIGYLLHSHFTFKVNNSSKRQFACFFILSVSIALLNAGLLVMLVEWWGIPPAYAQGGLALCMAFLSYVCQKKITFGL